MSRSESGRGLSHAQMNDNCACVTTEHEATENIEGFPKRQPWIVDMESKLSDEDIED